MPNEHEHQEQIVQSLEKDLPLIKTTLQGFVKHPRTFAVTNELIDMKYKYDSLVSDDECIPLDLMHFYLTMLDILSILNQKPGRFQKFIQIHGKPNKTEVDRKILKNELDPVVTRELNRVMLNKADSIKTVLRYQMDQNYSHPSIAVPYMLDIFIIAIEKGDTHFRDLFETKESIQQATGMIHGYLE